MRRFFHPALAALFFFSSLGFPSAGFSAAPVWPQDESDLKPDSAATFGALTNGLRYIILPNAEPKNRASLRLVVAAGSLDEKEDQRGLAHFLEHMAFNGSTHYPPGTLVEYFQRLGMSFGGDTNAYTTFDHTAYQIELPETNSAMLAEGLRVLADFAGGLLLPDAQIEKERGIILSEKRARDSVPYRTAVAEYEFLLGESLIPKRMTIGLSEVIEQAKRDRFVDFYNTWYRPGRMTVIVVGQVSPSEIEAMIKKAFGELAPRAPARPDPDLGNIPEARGMIARLHYDPEAPATTVSIETITPYAHEPDTAAIRLKYLPRDLAFRMLNRRLAILAKKDGAPFAHGFASVNESLDFYRNASIELVGRPDQWQVALGAAEQELRRALEHGFQTVELREAVDGFRSELEQAAKTAGTRRSGQLANELITATVRREVFTHPATDLSLYGPALDKLTTADCLDALRETWKPNHRYLFVAGNVPTDGGSTPGAVAASANIIAACEASNAVAVAPPEKADESPFAYTRFGAPGRVLARSHVDDLDLDLVQFTNGVRLNLKRTGFEKNTIHLSVRFGAGRLTEPASQPGLAFVANRLFTAGGLGRHSFDDLQRLFAGKVAGINFATHDDAFLLTGSTNREDLLAQLQLFAAYLTDPGFRPEALRQAHKDIEQLFNRFVHTPEGVLQTEIPYRLASGDSRFGLPAREIVLSRTTDEVKEWLAPALARGPLEIAIVGDFDLEATIGAVAQTLGTLPPRGTKPPFTESRRVFFPATPFDRTSTVASEIPKGIVALYWPTTDSRDIHRARGLALLADIFADRLRVKIREELGGTYSPFAANAPSDTYRDYGFFVAQCTVDPLKARDIANLILVIADDLRQNGVTEDELARARLPALTKLKESVRTNDYWLYSVLGSAQEIPQRLDWARTWLGDIQGITKPELDALAKTYLAASRAFRVLVLPESK